MVELGDLFLDGGERGPYLFHAGAWRDVDAGFADGGQDGANHPFLEHLGGRELERMTRR